MEAFKLLSRSTNLKPTKARPAHHIPSEGPIHPEDSGTERRGGPEVASVSAGKKRKWEDAQLENARTQETENSGFHDPMSDGKSIEENGQSPGLTAEVLPGEALAKSPNRFSPEECRQIFKIHKVKITSLTGDLSGASRDGTAASSRKSSKKVSKTHQLSKKTQKEASRLYTQPLTSFQSIRTAYNTSKALADNLEDQGYIIPTEVQLATIPLLLDPAAAGLTLPAGCWDLDLLTVAPTGSGKTLAFLIPLISHLVQDHHQSKSTKQSRHVSALIVAPTKELVGQIVSEGRKLCRSTGVSVTAMRKGMHLGSDGSNPGVQHDGDEEHGSGEAGGAAVVKADIIVTTPLLLANTLFEHKSSLSTVRYLILDEADVLLNPLFREQTLSLWDNCTNPSLRISLWSATIGSNIEELVINILSERRSRLHIQNETALVRCIIGLKDSALPTISHKLIYTATEPGKLLGLRQLLHPSTTSNNNRVAPPLRPPFLVFTQTIERAIALHAELLYDIPTEAGGSSRLSVLHSDLSDTNRSEIMARFRKGQIWVLITTDLLSRGVDFKGMNGVVNYDIPTSSAAYVHRVGRTGRAGREGGIAVTFYTREDIKYVKGIANAIAASEKARGMTNDAKGEDGVQRWLLDALPDISKNDRQELKKRGVSVRRKIRAGENDKEAKAKRKARISTKSGYERRLENNRKGAIAAMNPGSDDNGDYEQSEDEAWGGFEA
jgi:ATP-dependent RNA helicase DDX52/ROK1